MVHLRPRNAWRKYLRFEELSDVILAGVEYAGRLASNRPVKHSCEYEC